MLPGANVKVVSKKIQQENVFLNVLVWLVEITHNVLCLKKDLSVYAMKVWWAIHSQVAAVHQLSAQSGVLVQAVTKFVNLAVVLMLVEEKIVDLMHIATLKPKLVSAERDSSATHNCCVCHLLDHLFVHLDVGPTATVNMHHQTDVLVTKGLPEIRTLVAKHKPNKPVPHYSVAPMLPAPCQLEFLSAFVARAILEIRTVDVMTWMSVQPTFVD
jgi:hypothetical protein